MGARVKPLGQFIALSKSQKRLTEFLICRNRKIAQKNVNTIMELSLDWYKIFCEVEEMNTKGR